MRWKWPLIVLGVIAGLIALPWIILICAIPFNLGTASEQDLRKSHLMAEAPPPLTKPVTLKVVTFNIHDMLVISFDRPERMAAIGATLKELDPDLVGFQEAWVEKDRETLWQAVQGSRLKYRQYYPSGLLGSGKYILSAYPIQEAFFHRYTQGGKWYKPYHGDWWGGKGAALARVELPDNAGFIDLYDTHVHAGYGSPEYDGVRAAQLLELADFVHTSTVGTSPAFVVGDMNSHRDRMMLQDAMDRGQFVRMMTIDSSIDHIFAVRNPHYVFEVLDTQPIDKDIPVKSGTTHLSDHRGYISTIRVTPVPNPQTP
ncbi:MAG: endonuclease/exonuclease/phosphatase family protein [Candidatus Hydrogenedentes bacterium]|nr:endonuclease/exonuclease/phosphatase family protein [Candidatus Hydrogenedentota bacterium]